MEDVKFARGQMEDLVRWVDRTWQDGLTDFMARPQAEALMAGFRGSAHHMEAWGGYDDADRVRILVRAEDRPPRGEDFSLVVLSYRTREEGFQAGHRDYLGALMSLGIDRKKIGDIFVFDQGCDVVCDRVFAPFFQSAPLQVRGRTLALRILDLEDWQAPERTMVEKSVSVDSLRVDGVLARAFAMSRSQAKEAIRLGHVQVNNRMVAKSGLVLEPGMTLSCRGRGKCRLLGIRGQSRKGKTILTLGIYQ